jgi:DNA-binding transcriptional ArsR family regulator
VRRDVFQAIADPTRREIIMLLAHQTLTPNAVTEQFDHSRQAISKHIQILTECGLLSYEIHGREYYYSIQPKKLKEVHDWLDPLRDLWDKRFNQLDALLKEKKPKRKIKKS